MTPTISRTRLQVLLADAAAQHVVIVGDAMLDVYLRGDVDRISPEAPVPVVRVRDRKLALGGAANVAQNVAALGAGCDLVAVVGEDAAGRTLCAHLEAGHLRDGPFEEVWRSAKCQALRAQVKRGEIRPRSSGYFPNLHSAPSTLST
jgi:bifunctional ADP-heptose synthase (sugar kinase/adenylyltransferase)